MKRRFTTTNDADVSKYDINTVFDALPIHDPLWSLEFEEKTEDSPNKSFVGVCELFNCGIKKMPPVSLRPKPAYVGPKTQSPELETAFYSKWFDTSVTRDSVSVKTLSGAGVWNCFILNFQSQGLKTIYKWTQQWLSGTQRSKIFKKFKGSYKQCNSLIEMLQLLPRSNSSTVFVHFNWQNELIGVFNVNYSKTDTIRDDSDLILCFRIKKQVDPDRRSMLIDFHLDWTLSHHWNECTKAPIGTVALWINNMIPKCINHVNKKQNCQYPFYFGDQTDSVCFVAELFVLICNTLHMYYTVCFDL